MNLGLRPLGTGTVLRESPGMGVAAWAAGPGPGRCPACVCSPGSLVCGWWSVYGNRWQFLDSVRVKVREAVTGGKNTFPELKIVRL